MIRSATLPGMTRMIRNTTVATPSSVGMISITRFSRYVRMRAARSVLGEPDVLELLVGVVVGRGHVVLHLGPVHDPARPPQTGQIVGVLEHALLDLDDGLLALGGVEGPGLPGEEVVHDGIAEAAPVSGIAG